MKEPSKVIKLSYKKIKNYFTVDASPKEVEEVVVKALDALFEHEKNKTIEDDMETTNN